MKHCYHALLLLLACFSAPGARAQNETFSMRQLACGLSQPWEIKFGPDGYLWVTEAHSYQISRVDPASGNTEMLLDLSARKNFPNYAQADTWPQGGLQGIAFHPAFTGNPYVYVSYVYHFDSCKSNKGGCFFRTKIVRYNYDIATKAFSNETVITDSLPGSSDHNGGRLVVTPATVAGTAYLFYSIGDMGAGHLGNGSRQHRGQRTDILEGKVLRFNLMPDGDAGSDGWIPNDNPFNQPGKQNAVWSLGQRNPQGLAFSPSGTLYESEHGPYSDDEINVILGGHNYGFPLITGPADGNYDGVKAGAGSGLPMIISEQTNRSLIQAAQPYSDPIFSLFPASQTAVATYYNNDVDSTPPYPNYYLQYPTSAPSGIEYYGSDAIPGWKNSLLVANLKLAAVYRIQLTSGGLSAIGDTLPLFQGLGRFRDIAVSADGLKIYVAADSEGSVRGAPGLAVTPPNRGCILEFTYIPTGVKGTLEAGGIRLYPNPAGRQFSLVLPTGLSSADIRISNALGQQCLRTSVTANQSEISTASLSPGVYSVQVSLQDRQWVGKLVVR